MSMRRRLVLLLGAAAAGLTIGLPAIAAPPPHSAAGENPDKPGKPDKVPGVARAEVPLTLSGIVEQSPDEHGRPTFTMDVDGVTWELSAGPTWFWGERNPLAAWAGQPVDVAGTHDPGAAEPALHVERVNGATLRERGKPPWAGGPRVVGDTHPGWQDRKADRPHGAAGAPGHLKKDRDAAAGGDGEPGEP